MDKELNRLELSLERRLLPLYLGDDNDDCLDSIWGVYSEEEYLNAIFNVF
jgi:hypothetical protein